MTKRLTIALVAVALFVLMAVMPVLAETDGAIINGGQPVYIGEANVDLSRALMEAGGFNPVVPPTPKYTTIGWWAEGSSTASKLIDLGVGTPPLYKSVPTSNFAGYSGNWYCYNPATGSADGAKIGTPVFLAIDPSTYIYQGATIFIGEGGLNVTPALNNAAGTPISGTPPVTLIGWWASAAVIGTTSPTKTIDLGVSPKQRYLNMQVAPADFVGYTGNWYLVNPATGFAVPGAVFNVADPTLSIAVWDFRLLTGNPVTGKSVVQGEPLGFQLDTNMYAALDGITRGVGSGYPYASSGYITIKVKDANGATYNALQVGTPGTAGASVSLLKQLVNTQPWYFGTSPTLSGQAYNALTTVAWITDAADFNNQYLYPVGTYSAWAESTLHNMKDNYKNAGADYTGKTVSGVGTITLVSDTVKIEANKDTVVRSKTFSVTVTGKPTTLYHLWVKGTSTMTSGYDNQPPMVQINQEGVQFDPDSPFTGLAGLYQYENGVGKTIWDDVAAGDATTRWSSRYYANITTTASGTRTVEWTTTNWTKAQKYTIRVEQRFPIGSAYNAPGSAIKSDEVDVKVEKGAVTIVAAGDQSYYLGEEIKFSGTNTESYNTYLFIIGPNLPTQGGQIQSNDPRSTGLPGVTDMNANTFQQVDVAGDNTWSWKWGTSNVALDAGTYTIYAVSQPRDSKHLEQTAFGTVSIIIKKPFVSATASQSTVAQGDKIFITGTAEGDPIAVKIWILGKNYPTTAAGIKDESVNSDASFKYEVTQDTTRNLYPGQYFVVVQHPMQNDVFDVDTYADPLSVGVIKVINKQLASVTGNPNSQTIFTLLGPGSLQGSDAAEALVQGINSPNVDDTYTKLQFLVEVPVIRIDPVGDKHVGDKFTITASTNLAVDDEILVEVYSSSFKPTQKSQSGEFSGATGTVKVTKGDSGMNKISFDVDSSTFKPDEYIVTEQAVLQGTIGTALFNVLEGAAPVVTTKAPVVVTTVAPVVTTVAPVVTTVVPTTTPKPAPGYGALIALIGLGAVAFIVVRRH